MPTSLSVARLIQVALTLSPQAAQAQNLSTLLILGSTPVIDVKTRKRDYTALTQVATDFGTSAPEYQAASLWFEQNPQPTTLSIGRWAQAATPGQLIGSSLPASTLAALQAITTGSFTITIDANAAQNLSALNFSGAFNLNGVAAIIGAALLHGTILYNATFNRFEITSATSGAPSIVSFATPTGSGTDISALLGLSNANGAYQANGIAAESALAAATLFDTTFGQQWFGLQIPAAVAADHLAVAGFIEASSNYHVYGVTTQDASVLVPTTTTDIASQLKALGYNRTIVDYSSTNPYAVASLLGRILTVDYTGNNTTITLMYKQAPGIVPETLNETQADALEAKNCNVYVQYNNNTAIIEPGVASSGIFFDSITGSAAFAVAIQTACFNLFFLSPTKIPQTDAGMHVIATTIEAVCAQFVANGFLAPGVWNSAGFGTIKQGDLLSKGYYVFTPPLSTQSQAGRGARISVPIQIAAKQAGAVHKVNLAITVNA